MRGTRGSATVEIAVLAPVLLLVVFTIIQVGLWSYARSLALGAAQEGVAAGRAYGAPAEAGRVRAEQFLAATAGDSLLGSAVLARATPGTLRIEVTGRAQSVIPGVPGLPVRQHAEGPMERVTTP
ncbi:MAG: pilus assembly protein [Candidatus Nanopelagicales bacterium]|nr:pilus assembly protein [Candidatus Nanopelagicales bacterium]